MSYGGVWVSPQKHTYRYIDMHAEGEIYSYFGTGRRVLYYKIECLHLSLQICFSQPPPPRKLESCPKYDMYSATKNTTSQFSRPMKLGHD